MTPRKYSLQIMSLCRSVVHLCCLVWSVIDKQWSALWILKCRVYSQDTRRISDLIIVAVVLVLGWPPTDCSLPPRHGRLLGKTRPVRNCAAPPSPARQPAWPALYPPPHPHHPHYVIGNLTSLSRARILQFLLCAIDQTVQHCRQLLTTARVWSRMRYTIEATLPPPQQFYPSPRLFAQVIVKNVP